MSAARLFVASLLLLMGCRAAPDTESQQTLSEVRTDAHDVAWDVMSSAHLLTLITLDEAGQPQARILEALPPDSGRFDIWMGTNARSAKVQEIRANPRATVFYHVPDGAGYVTLRGRASIVEDAEFKERYWQPHWTAFYPDPDEMYVLIHFIPEDGEVVHLGSGLEGDSLTWAAPELIF